MKEGAIFRRGMVVVMLALAVTACIGKFRDASGVSNLEPPANAIPGGVGLAEVNFRALPFRVGPPSTRAAAGPLAN